MSAIGITFFGCYGVSYNLVSVTVLIPGIVAVIVAYVIVVAADSVITIDIPFLIPAGIAEVFAFAVDFLPFLFKIAVAVTIAVVVAIAIAFIVTLGIGCIAAFFVGKVGLLLSFLKLGVQFCDFVFVVATFEKRYGEKNGENDHAKLPGETVFIHKEHDLSEGGVRFSERNSRRYVVNEAEGKTWPGGRLPRADVALNIAKALGSTVEELFGSN